LLYCLCVDRHQQLFLVERQQHFNQVLH
jgi:hypothetical protein